MKTISKTIIAFFIAGFFSATAQSKNDETAVENTFKAAYEAYNKGDSKAGIAFYSENASEVSPDGSIMSGKTALLKGWDAFMKMVDEKPSFRYSNLSVRFISSDVAILTWESNDEFKIQGQKVTGNMRCLGVMKKTNGKWLMEADSVTPITPAPQQAIFDRPSLPPGKN